MNNIDWSQFEPVESEQSKDNSKSFDWTQFEPVEEEKKEEEEGFLKSGFRTVAQPLLGFLSTTTPGLLASFFELLATGEAFDPEAISGFKKASEEAGIPFDEDKYLEAAHTYLSHIPTVSNLARITEEKTGLPLQPKTKTQKGLRFATEVGRITPGATTQKLASAGTATAAKIGLEEAGVPEPLAELAGLATGIPAGIKTPAYNVSIGKKTKPSGLPERRFEKLKEPRQVSESKLSQINEKLETDFKNISDKIIESSPIQETRTSLKENAGFKNEVRDQFKKVEEFANSIPKRLNTTEVKNKLVNNVLSKKGTGFAPGEYDKDFRSFVKNFIKETPTQEVGAVDLVKQYRKNNQELSGAYDPSRSYNYNRAKKDALLEYNRALSDVIEEQFPNSDFSNLFKETNKQWSKIADAEAIDKFIDGLFDGKIRFEKGKRFFENENLARPFKRALGEEGFKEFESLMKDLMSSETPYKMLQVAKKSGWKELVSTAGAYLISPKLGGIKTGYEIGKRAFKATMNSLLDKPQLTISLKKGIDNLKKGKFAEAEKQFNALKGELEVEKKVKPPFKEETIDVKPQKVTESPKELESKSPEKPTSEVKTKEIEHKPKQIQPKSLNDKVDKNFLDVLPTTEEIKTMTFMQAKDKANQLQDIIEKYENVLNESVLNKYADARDELDAHAIDVFNPSPTKADIAKKNVAKKRAERAKKQEKKVETQVKEKIPEVKRQDISVKGLKSQKQYLLSEIDKALKNPPSGDKVVFDVPGDGVFKINNNENALKKFAEAINKNWPDKAKPETGMRLKGLGGNKYPDYPEYAFKDYEIAQKKRLEEELKRVKESEKKTKSKRK